MNYYISIKSNSQDPIITRLAINKNKESGNITIMADCSNEGKYLRLKTILGSRTYYEDEGKLSLFSEEYSLRIKSKNSHLLRFFLQRLIQSTPDLGRILDREEIKKDPLLSKAPYQSEEEFPSWDIVDTEEELPTQSLADVVFNNCSATRKVQQIRLLFWRKTARPHTFCIVFDRKKLANDYLEGLRELDSNFWGRTVIHNKTFLFSVNEDSGKKERLVQAITFLFQYDPTVNLALIGQMNQYLKIEDQFTLNFQPPPRPLLQLSSSRQSKLIEQIEAVKHSLENLKKVLDGLGDRLLNASPSYVIEREEFKEACEHLVKLKENDKLFYKHFFNIYAGYYDNKDDLQYLLEKRRFHYHFIYSENTPESKACHLNILRGILDGISALTSTRLSVDKDPTQNEVENLRRELLIWQVKPHNQFQKETNLALLILAKYYPINPECYITLDAIDPLDRFITTVGFQFSVNALLEYQNTRPLSSELKEKNEKLFYILPNNRNAMNEFDMAQFNSRIMNQPFTNNDSNPVESLYDLQFAREIRAVRKTLYINTGGYAINPSLSVRIARLPESNRTRLLENMSKGKSSFVFSLVSLYLSTPLSVEQFASLDSDKQYALGSMRDSINYPNFPGLDIQGLIALTADQIKTIFAPNGYRNYLDQPMNGYSIGELNRIIQSALAENKATTHASSRCTFK